MTAKIIPFDRQRARNRQAGSNVHVIRLEDRLPGAFDKLVQKLLDKMDKYRQTNKTEDPRYYPPIKEEMYAIAYTFEQYRTRELENKMPVFILDHILDFQKFFGIRRKKLK